MPLQETALARDVASLGCVAKILARRRTYHPTYPPVFFGRSSKCRTYFRKREKKYEKSEALRLKMKELAAPIFHELGPEGLKRRSIFAIIGYSVGLNGAKGMPPRVFWLQVFGRIEENGLRNGEQAGLVAHAQYKTFYESGC